MSPRAPWVVGKSSLVLTGEGRPRSPIPSFNLASSLAPKAPPTLSTQALPLLSPRLAWPSRCCWLPCSRGSEMLALSPRMKSGALLADGPPRLLWLGNGVSSSWTQSSRKVLRTLGSSLQHQQPRPLPLDPWVSEQSSICSIALTGQLAALSEAGLPCTCPCALGLLPLEEREWGRHAL